MKTAPAVRTGHGSKSGPVPALALSGNGHAAIALLRNCVAAHDATPGFTLPDSGDMKALVLAVVLLAELAAELSEP